MSLLLSVCEHFPSMSFPYMKNMPDIDCRGTVSQFNLTILIQELAGLFVLCTAFVLRVISLSTKKL